MTKRGGRMKGRELLLEEALVRGKLQIRRLRIVRLAG
jgi:hypothetical protein